MVGDHIGVGGIALFSITTTTEMAREISRHTRTHARDFGTPHANGVRVSIGLHVSVCLSVSGQCRAINLQSDYHPMPRTIDLHN